MINLKKHKTFYLAFLQRPLVTLPKTVILMAKVKMIEIAGSICKIGLDTIYLNTFKDTYYEGDVFTVYTLDVHETIGSAARSVILQIFK